jgi:hypothetical protein
VSDAGLIQSDPARGDVEHHGEMARARYADRKRVCDESSRRASGGHDDGLASDHVTEVKGGFPESGGQFCEGANAPEVMDVAQGK